MAGVAACAPPAKAAQQPIAAATPTALRRHSRIVASLVKPDFANASLNTHRTANFVRARSYKQKAVSVQLVGGHKNASSNLGV